MLINCMELNFLYFLVYLTQVWGLEGSCGRGLTCEGTEPPDDAQNVIMGKLRGEGGSGMGILDKPWSLVYTLLKSAHGSSQEVG